MEYTTSNTLDERKTIQIFDTTLRDGEQSALCTMYPSEKIKIAKKLEEFGVDTIEAGFAASSKENFETIQRICETIEYPYVASLSRCKMEDILAAYGALKKYDKRMIHLFMPTSEIQVFQKMKKDYSQIEKMIRDSLREARKYFDRIEFSCEDATRTSLEVLEKIYGIAIEEGAGVVNIPDTVGQIHYRDYFGLVKKITEFVKSKNPEAITSAHCHDDRGFAIINSLEAIAAGAEQIECTINGIGERAGNCPVEQIVANEIIGKEFETNLKPELIHELSRMVSEATGTRNDCAPITGTAAFSHKAGIHQHGIIVNTRTYEHLDAKRFGRKTQIVIGPHSGCHGVISKAKELGVDISVEKATRVLEIVAEEVRLERKKRFSDRDIVRFINELK